MKSTLSINSFSFGILNVTTFLPLIVGIPCSSLPILLTLVFLFLNLPVRIVSPTFTSILIASDNDFLNPLYIIFATFFPNALSDGKCALATILE